MATSRIDMRIDDRVKAIAEKAAALTGTKSLTEYVTRVVMEDAEKVVREHEAMTLNDDVFDRFIAACDAADAPNEKLRAAREYTEEKGIQ